MKVTPAEIAKFITSVIGAASIAVTQGLIAGTAAKWVAVIIGVATALGVYVVPNALPAGTKLVKLGGPGEAIKSGRPLEPTEPAPEPPGPSGRPHGGGPPS
jgi:hypothetical protein